MLEFNNRTDALTMKLDSQVSIQALVFALVASSFTVVYITQPVLPVLETEFGTDARTASLSVSAVIFAMALANLPFGALVDRYPIKPIILIGGSVIATRQSDLRSDASLRTPHRSSLHSRSIHSVAHDLHRRLSGAESARRSSQRRHGILCRRDRGRRLRRTAAGWLDSSAAALALRICQRFRLGDCSNDRRGSLAAGRKFQSEERSTARWFH